MTKTNYKKIKIIKDWGIHIHKYFSPELKLEYDKLITDMKVFFRDSYHIPESLLSISESDNTYNEDIKKIFNLIPTKDEHNMWEELNCRSSYDSKTKKTKYSYNNKEFKNPKKKSQFATFFSDGKNQNLFASMNPFYRTNDFMHILLSSHNIKAHEPENISEKISSKDLLSNYLSKSEITFTKYQGGKESESIKVIYPTLHPRIITYISLIKRAFSIFLKSHNINFSSIDIFPQDNRGLLIFIASSEAKEINTFCSENSFLASNGYRGSNEVECSPLANGFNNFLDKCFEKSNLFHHHNEIYNDLMLYFDINIYTRDKSLRFNTIMNKRMDRIIKTIKSLNNLHHKGNYEFNKEDFDISYEKLSMAIQQYRSLYEKWFEDNAEPKTAEEEIEMLERKIAEKKKLLKNSKK